MSNKSREYRALELLGPGDSDASWRPRLELANFIGWSAIAKQAAEVAGVSLPRAIRRMESIAQSEIPPNCGIKMELTADVRAGRMRVEAKIA